jgi:hypothetical protein
MQIRKLKTISVANPSWKSERIAFYRAQLAQIQFAPVHWVQIMDVIISLGVLKRLLMGLCLILLVG